MPETILVITGPTASGKTEFALNIARSDARIEIVNADASLIYRGFDIGTAKPSEIILADDRSFAEEIKTLNRHFPHHIIDILDPDEEFNAVEYSKLAREIIRDIFSRSKIPIIVGGTGLYIDALFEGIMPVDTSEGTIRASPMMHVYKDKIAQSKERYSREFQELGFDEMHERLREIDPILFTQIRRERNPVRLERAWTHYYATGETLGEARKRSADRNDPCTTDGARSYKFEFRPEYKVLNVPRPELWRRIEDRVDKMIADGWLDEAKALMANGVTRDMRAMRAIGYWEMFDIIEGKLSLEEARELIVIRTRQYAKRQATWMKKYISANDPSSA